MCVGLVLANLAAAAAVSRHPDEAERLAERSIKILEVDNAPNAPIFLRPLQILAAASVDSGHIAKSRKTYDRMLQISAETPFDVYLIHMAAARLLDQEERLKECEAEILAALDALHKTEYAGRGDEAALLRSLTLLLIKTGRYDEARASINRAFAMAELANDSGAIDRADTLHVRAILRAHTREWSGAERDLREAIAILDTGSHADQALLHALLVRHADALRHIHRAEEARVVKRRAAAVFDSSAAHAVVDVGDLEPKSKQRR